MNPQPLESEIKKRYSGLDYLKYENANEEAFLNLQILALEDAGFIEEEVHTEAQLRTEGRHRGAISEQRAFLRAFVPLCEEFVQPRILDVGCATGSLLAWLRERGWETVGVEISAPQAEYARRERKLDVRSLPLAENKFPDGHFNAVLASHLIEHLNDPAALVKEVHRILAPGGCFFVTTPNIAGFQARLFKGRWRSAIFDHLYLFSVKTLTRLLEENGFTIEKIATWGGLAAGTAPVSLKRIFDKAAKRFGFGDVMIIKAKKVRSYEILPFFNS